MVVRETPDEHIKISFFFSNFSNKFPKIPTNQLEQKHEKKQPSIHSNEPIPMVYVKHASNKNVTNCVCVAPTISNRPCIKEEKILSKQNRLRVLLT